MANKDGVGVIEAPPTPGRPIFSFSVGSRKNFPSKWDDAEKWLISAPAAHHHHHHLHGFVKSPKHYCGQQQHEEEKVSKSTSNPSDHVLLKDKLTNEEEATFSRFKCVVPEKDASTGCPTPYKSVSPPRHTTPASMSGPLALMNASCTSFELQECHLAKLQPGTCNWSSREEEEEDVSKSLRHFEINNQPPKTIPAPSSQEEEKARSHHLHQRYQREEAKIQAWVNLQNAKAEAQSRKLEVKIQKIRSKFEDRMMKRMVSVDRKAEELRAAAQYEHKMQPSRKSKEILHFCGCFPCNHL